jgi:HlyD family secretion protein
MYYRGIRKKEITSLSLFWITRERAAIFPLFGWNRLLRAPADGVVTVIVAEVGENVSAGQPVLVVDETGKRWFSFNAREDLLHGLTVGAALDVARSGAQPRMPAVVTEVLPLGTFATWQAERAIGDHDRNTLRLRLDPQADAIGFEPGMTVWIHR